MFLMGVIINLFCDEEREGFMFGVYCVEDELLVVIRIYWGVERVECNYRVEFDVNVE